MATIRVSGVGFRVILVQFYLFFGILQSMFRRLHKP